MDEDLQFFAMLETEEVGVGLFRAVLVMGADDGSPDGVLRVPLAGEHPTAEDAVAAAKRAIKAMAGGLG